MSMIRRTCVEIHKTFQFIIQQLLTLHSTLLKSIWRKNQSIEFSSLHSKWNVKLRRQLTDFF